MELPNHVNFSAYDNSTQDVGTAEKLAKEYCETDSGYAFISKPASWIMQYGIWLISLAFGIFICLSFVIKYPDKISAKGYITSKHPPIEHYLKIPGVIKSLNVKNGDIVKKGSVIIYLDNTTNVSDLILLNKFIDEYSVVQNLNDYLILEIPTKLQLGEISDTYNDLIIAYQNLQINLRQFGVFSQIKTLQKEIINNRQLNEVLMNDQNLTAVELKLKVTDYERNVDLNEGGFISDLDKEKSKIELLQYEKKFNQTHQAIILNEIKSNQLSLEIQKLSEERKIKINDAFYNIKTKIIAVKQKIKSWEETYLITAKTQGRVSMSEKLHPSQFIGIDKPVVTIIPASTDQKKYASVVIPSINSEKIDIGSMAIVKFDAYPYKEFGVVKSEVLKFSSIPLNSNEDNLEYELIIRLEDRLITTFGKQIPYQPYARISVDIISKDKSIFERIFESLLSLIIT